MINIGYINERNREGHLKKRQILGITLFVFVNIVIICMAILLFARIYELHISGRLSLFPIFIGLVSGMTIAIVFFRIARQKVR